MINYDDIGFRIYMARKRRRLSQEELAEALGLYQADISNLERNKKGSGIMDLSRLEMMAEYFHMPLEQLLFGISRTNEEQRKEGNEMTNEEKIAKYKELLSFETILEQPTAWDEAQAYYPEFAETVEKLRAELDIEEYDRWKVEYIETEYQKLKDRRRLVTIYFQNVEGMKYSETTSRDEVPGWLDMLEEYQDIIFLGLGYATEEELRLFIAKMAYDEDLRDVYFEAPRRHETSPADNNGGDIMDIPYDVDEELPFT